MTTPRFAPSVIILSALNALLRRESWASTALSEYAGKTVLFKLAGKNVLQAAINSSGLLDNSDSAVIADVILDLPFDNLTDLLQAFRAGGADAIAKQMHIQGDAGLAQLLSDLAKNLRWDAQADLARVFGDIAAVRITGFTRFAFDRIQGNSRRFNDNIREYLSNEADIAVKNTELNTFKNDLAALQKCLDSLDARLNRLAGV